MYNITELNEMPDADLKSVAEGMGIKKIDLSKREELVYRILDQQAIDRAAATTAERKRRAEATGSAQEEKTPKKKRTQEKRTTTGRAGRPGSTRCSRTGFRQLPFKRAG